MAKAAERFPTEPSLPSYPNTPKSLGKKGRHLTEKLCSTYDSAGPQRQGHQDFGFRQDIYAAADVR